MAGDYQLRLPYLCRHLPPTSDERTLGSRQDYDRDLIPLLSMTILETPRLLFRPLTPEDADDLAALYVDPEIMRYFEGTRTREQTVTDRDERP